MNEVLRHLSETGAIYQDATGRWTAEDSLEQMALPDSVREVIGARVGRLGQDRRRVLSLAAVIGRDFDLDLLARATEDDRRRAARHPRRRCGGGPGAGTGRHPGRYTFAHALIQHTLYDDLGPNRRARAHRQVAEALEELCAETVPEPAWASWPVTGCRHPVPSTWPRRSTTPARQATPRWLLLPPRTPCATTPRPSISSPSRRPRSCAGVDLAIGLGTAQRQTGDAAFRDTLVDAAHRAAELGETDRLAAAALANNRGWFSTAGGVDADKVAILELALERLPSDDPDRALVLATLCSELTHGSSLERRQALADEALAIAESSGDDARIVRVLNTVCLSLQVPPLLEQSLCGRPTP